MNCWSSIDVVKLKAMLEKGWSYRDIGAVLNRTGRAVKQKAHELRNPRPSRRRGYTREETELIMRLKGQGVADREIAARIGRTVTQIRDKVSSMRNSVGVAWKRQGPESLGRVQPIVRTRIAHHLRDAPQIPDSIRLKACHEITEDDIAVIEDVKRRVREVVLSKIQSGEIAPR